MSHQNLSHPSLVSHPPFVAPSAANVASTHSLPLLDLALLNGSETDRQAFLADLRHAARDIGFFYLTGHGIDPTLLEQIQTLSRQFFALPDEEKLAVAMVNSPHFRGYNRAAAELTRGQPDWREQFDIGAERTPLPQTLETPRWAQLQGPNQWPAALPELKPALLQWQREMTGMALRLLRAFALALDLDENAFDELYGDKPNEHIKLIRYPGRETTQSGQGVGAHKDSGFLSFLLQDKQRGLQVEVEEGRWIDAVPQPGTFVVNIGELLELASNGYLRATVHRVETPPAGTDRLSIAFFLGARLDAVVPLYQLPAAIAAEARGPASDPQNPLFRDVGLNYLKGRLRSHPDVASRHYPGVIASSETTSTTY
ncbi:isopenicillin N synthase family oxygenase [Yersinia massiliensis]|uniref:2-oxoglutarate-dependent ethylene/succinate-forming enzyme n=2 Tax=Yersinia TaxID=629 RepID=A0AAI8ZSH5_YERFR|nr:MULTISPECIES: isopenicillin N synthase family oxygenase [Yersinia]MDA5549735.1 isopenicillin N synthase family oxygenase [Yersinia massiliensis]MDN0125821.1 isopenicillin N synthase family oxygenase [Yersinia massiliensis]NIL25308.1 isopenicillin N synthase family oxygenase [Yersinia massiliensis]QKJ09606.1 isopenicillin N synthase family oxygenase [Yersinia massiliensis]UZM77668.1 isopenicillin N synthase family oxygenase [Yersinia massiliensis]